MDNDMELVEQDLINKFIQILKQETLAPDILPYQKAVFDRLQNNVKQQENGIKQYVKPDDDTGSHQKSFKFLIYKSQTERINYLLKEYLRVRLRKVEKFGFFLFKNQTQAEHLLSQNQLQFLKKYSEVKYKYLQDNILKNIIKSYRGLGGLQSFFNKTSETKILLDTKQSKVDIPEPNLDGFVFAKIEANPAMVRFNYDIQAANVEGQPVIQTGSIVYVPYRVLLPFIQDGNAFLL